jgi:hypothetical protein
MSRGKGTHHPGAASGKDIAMQRSTSSQRSPRVLRSAQRSLSPYVLEDIGFTLAEVRRARFVDAVAGRSSR